jgi:hypothetical protein
MSDYREEMARACFGANGNLMPWRDAPEKLRDGWRAVADDVISQLPDSLDAAWAEAEAVLPEGWMLERVWRNAGAWNARAGEGPYPAAIGVQQIGGSGPTPAAALRALAAKLRMLPVMDTTR